MEGAGRQRRLSAGTAVLVSPLTPTMTQSHRRHQPSLRRKEKTPTLQPSSRWFLSLLPLFVLFISIALHHVQAYTRTPCTRAIRGHFQYPECFVPRLDPNLELSKASFLLSHDAATGYLSGSVGPIHSAINLYAKTQRGTVTEQLQAGARALDLRPHYLHNKTVVFHHGAVVIPVTFESVVQEAKDWASANPDELVLLFHSHATLQFSNMSMYTDGVPTMVGALQDIYSSMGITYLACADIYGWTVGDAMEAGEISGTGGSIIALDYQDRYLSMCAKMNYVESRIVTCYPTKASSSNAISTSTSTSDADGGDDAGNSNTNATMGIPPCTNKKSPAFEQLHQYLLASANNPASDDDSSLGPPASLDRFPFSELQALWQVDTHAAAAGVAHISSLLDDTTKSNLHKSLVSWIHNGDFSDGGISLFAVDYVTLHGNAIFSVLRTQCGQSDVGQFCGADLAAPRIFQKRFNTISWFLSIVVYTMVIVWIWAMVRHYFRHYQHERQMQRLSKDMEYAREALHCGAQGTFT